MSNAQSGVPLVGRLPSGPLDIVGDIHGEIDALEGLLQQLGYRSDGSHPEQRHLVFLGDLVDRGPESPAVLHKVMTLVSSGYAQCLVGNHELNLLRDVERHGNSWWVKPEARSRHPARRVDPAQKRQLGAFLATLPLALERDDLRVVHACWQADAVAALRARQPGEVLGLYREFADAMRAQWRSSGLSDAYRAEWRRHGSALTDRSQRPPLLPAMARVDTDHQMANPVALLTSGAERPANEPFWAGGKWRMVERVKWWETYRDEVPVVIGHYWRRFSEAGKVMMDKHGPDLFAGVEPHHWMGARTNVYCVDFSVGGRYVEREAGRQAFHCKLAALRVPEWRVVHDDGTTWEIGQPGPASQASAETKPPRERLNRNV